MSPNQQIPHKPLIQYTRLHKTTNCLTFGTVMFPFIKAVHIFLPSYWALMFRCSDQSGEFHENVQALNSNTNVIFTKVALIQT